MNFVVFGQQRTGSTLLVRLLQSHPQVQCDGELFGNYIWGKGYKRWLRPLVRRFPEPYIRWKASRSTAPVYGFKLLVNQVAAPSTLIARLQRSGWQMIHIQRRRLFDVAMSRTVATMTGHWAGFQNDGQPAFTSLAVAPERLLQQAQQCITLRQKELVALRTIPHLLVMYEDDLLDDQNRNRICSLIFAALQIEQRPVFTARQRSWDRPYRELVTNYAELAALMTSAQGMALQLEWERLIAHG